MPQIPPPDLRDLLLRCLEASGYEGEIPHEMLGRFALRFRRTGNRDWLTARVAIRTITRDIRQKDKWEERLKIQKTGLQDVSRDDLDALLGVTVIGGEPVVVSFDVGHHLPTRGKSNNVQFPEDLAVTAASSSRTCRIVKKKSRDLVEAFPGVMLGDFLAGRLESAARAPTVAQAAPGVAASGGPEDGQDEEDEIAEGSLEFVGPPVYRTYRQLARDPAFAAAVRDLYQHQCAACGLSFGMAEAAHLVPHAVSGESRPENGVLLCPNHHEAFDRVELVTFDSARHVWVNIGKLNLLEERGHADGRALLIDSLLPSLARPTVAIDQTEFLARRFQMSRGTDDEASSCFWVRRSEI